MRRHVCLLPSLLVASLPACGGGGSGSPAGPTIPAPAPAPRPNIVFILADDLDLDNVAYMPRLKALLADRGNDLRERLRHHPPVLALPRLVPDRAVRPQPRPPGQPAAPGGLRAMGRERQGAGHDRHGPEGRGLPHHPDRQVHERLPARQPALHRAGVGRLARDFLEPEPGALLRLLLQRQRHDHELRHPSRRLRDRRDGHEGGGRPAARRDGGRQPALLPLSRRGRAPHPGLSSSQVRGPVPGPGRSSHGQLQRGRCQRQAGIRPSVSSPFSRSGRAPHRLPLSRSGGLPPVGGRAARQGHGRARRPGRAREHPRGLHFGQRLLPRPAPLQPRQGGALRGGDPRSPRGPGAGGGRRCLAASSSSNLDLAPTFAALAGATLATEPDGRSLVSLLSGSGASDWRRDLLLEFWQNSDDPDDDDGGIPTWQALRNEATLYVDYETSEGELYDLQGDPAELDSQYLAASSATLQPLEQRLAALKACRGSSCR